MDHSNLFHAALIAIRDIAQNGTRDVSAWRTVTDIVDAALAKARQLDSNDRERAAGGQDAAI